MKKIYLSGGGINGITYIGVIKKLEENNKIKNISSFHGVSIGSLFSCLLCLGYSYKELENIIFSTDLNKLKNISTLSLLKNFGLDDGTYLENWIKKLISDKGFSHNITYYQLKNITNKKLITYATEITTQEFFRFDYKLTPDTPIYLGIRMSMNIPIFYSPYNYKNMLFVDGAVINNFPFLSFEKNLNKSIGFFILIEKIKKENSFTFSNYLEMLLNCPIKKDIHKLFLKNLNIIYIKNDNFVNFNIDKKDIIYLIEQGYNSFKID